MHIFYYLSLFSWATFVVFKSNRVIFVSEVNLSRVIIVQVLDWKPLRGEPVFQHQSQLSYTSRELALICMWGSIGPKDGITSCLRCTCHKPGVWLKETRKKLASCSIFWKMIIRDSKVTPALWVTEHQRTLNRAKHTAGIWFRVVTYRGLNVCISKIHTPKPWIPV